MAAMGHQTGSPVAQSAAPAATSATTAAAVAPPAAPQINAVATQTPAPAVSTPPAPTTAPAPTTEPAPTNAPAPTSTPAPTPAPGVATTVSVTLTDMAIKLSTASVPSGTVTFAVTNGGGTTHEFVVLQTAIAQNALPADPANPGTVQEPGFLGRVASLAPHATGSLTLTLGPGSYVLICNEPAHYSALGMHIGFSVR